MSDQIEKTSIDEFEFRKNNILDLVMKEKKEAYLSVGSGLDDIYMKRILDFSQVIDLLKLIK